MRISDWSSDVCSSDLFNDFEVGKRAGFKPAEMLNMLDAEARVVQCGGIPDDLLGLDRFEARRLVVERLEALGLLEQIEDRVIQRSEEHTSELQSLMRISYAVFCLKKKKIQAKQTIQ